MTKSELDAIDLLCGEVAAQRKELHDYHCDVKTLVKQCECCRDDVEKLLTDMYGSPENRENSPGVLDTVQGLCQSRRLMVRAMRGVWALLVVVFSAIAAAAARKIF